jgi:hypothetical protein
MDVNKPVAKDEQSLSCLRNSRWPKGVLCPICGDKESSNIKHKSKTKNVRAQLYQCLEKTCKQQFCATTGTNFHNPHLPLSKWFTAIALIVDTQKGMSALQLSRHLRSDYPHRVLSLAVSALTDIPTSLNVPTLPDQPRIPPNALTANLL